MLAKSSLENTVSQLFRSSLMGKGQKENTVGLGLGVTPVSHLPPTVGKQKLIRFSGCGYIS